MHDEPYDDEELPVSKSQLKREATELQELGEKLVALPAQVLAEIPLPEPLREAVEAARRIHAHGGRKRQLQYIGKLMRQVDADPIREAVERFENRGKQAAAQLHRIEHWRDRLIEESDEALAPLLEEYPHADRQQLRQLIRNAREERKREKPPKSARALFKLLREMLG